MVTVMLRKLLPCDKAGRKVHQVLRLKICGELFGNGTGSIFRDGRVSGTNWLQMIAEKRSELFLEYDQRPKEVFLVALVRVHLLGESVGYDVSFTLSLWLVGLLSEPRHPPHPNHQPPQKKDGQNPPSVGDIL